MSIAFAPPIDYSKQNFSLITGDDLHLFNEGTHSRLYDKFGAHPMKSDGVDGTYFAVQAADGRILLWMRTVRCRR